STYTEPLAWMEMAYAMSVARARPPGRYWLYNARHATSRYFLDLAGPTRSGVSSAHTTCARVSRARMRLSTTSSSPAARASMPCTNPAEGAAPVSDSNSAITRPTGRHCTTSRYTHRACRFGP